MLDLFSRDDAIEIVPAKKLLARVTGAYVADEGRFPTAVDPDGDRPDVADRTPSAPAAAG